MTDQELQIIFWDVQHGHSTFIKTPSGEVAFIDLGIGSHSEHKRTFSPLLHCMSRNGIKRINKVIITHPHLDHIDDILSLDKFSIGEIYYPTGIDTNQLIDRASNGYGSHDVVMERVKKFKHYRKITKDFNGLNRSTTKFSVGDVKFTLFRALNQGTNLNNWSIVTVIEYLNWKFVIPGDNESPSFNELFEISSFESTISNAEVLLAPHHGRRNGFDDDFMYCVNPDIVVISDSHYHNTSVQKHYSEYADGFHCWHRNSEKYNWRKVLSTHGDNVISVKCGYLKNKKYFDIIYG